MRKFAYIAVLLLLSLSIAAQDIPSDSIERANLARKVERRIAMEFGVVDALLPQINIYSKKGEIVQAREMVEDALIRIAKIEADQQLLAQLDETADEETLMSAQTLETKNYLISKANLLRNAIGVCLQCNATLFDINYSGLCSEIQGDLSEVGVFFVDSAEQGAWTIVVDATAREYRKEDFGKVSSYVAYVDAKIAIRKMKTGKLIYEDLLSEKGIHTHNYEQAAREAYKEISPKISSIIIEQISK